MVVSISSNRISLLPAIRTRWFQRHGEMESTMTEPPSGGIPWTPYLNRGSGNMDSGRRTTAPFRASNQNVEKSPSASFWVNSGSHRAPFAHRLCIDRKDAGFHIFSVRYLFYAASRGLGGRHDDPADTF